MFTRKRDLGVARQVANLERVRAQELRESLEMLTAALDSADATAVRCARIHARNTLDSDRRRTQGVD